MATKHMKGCSTSSVISEMQISEITRHITRIATSTRTKRELRRTWRHWTLVHCPWECDMVWPLGKSPPQKAKRTEFPRDPLLDDLPYDPLVGVYPR